MRISDWSSDVCSSDLGLQDSRNFCFVDWIGHVRAYRWTARNSLRLPTTLPYRAYLADCRRCRATREWQGRWNRPPSSNSQRARKSVVEGKGVSGRGGLGG